MHPLISALRNLIHQESLMPLTSNSRFTFYFHLSCLWLIVWLRSSSCLAGISELYLSCLNLSGEWQTGALVSLICHSSPLAAWAWSSLLNDSLLYRAMAEWLPIKLSNTITRLPTLGTQVCHKLKVRYSWPLHVH